MRWMLIAGTMAAMSLPIAVAAETPPRSDAGNILAVPDTHLDAGLVYHFWPGQDAQLVISSETPLRRLAVVCKRVVGYVVVPFDLEDATEPIVGGSLRIPTHLLRTGNLQLDSVIGGAPMLDASNHPEILVDLSTVRDVKQTQADPPTYTLTATLALEVKEASHTLDVPFTITLQRFTWQTLGHTPGELLTIRSTFELPLAKIGLSVPGPQFANQLADSVSVEVFLLGSTVSPAKSLDPSVSQSTRARQERYFTLLRDLDRPVEAFTLGRGLAQDLWDNANALHSLALSTITDETIRYVDLAFLDGVARRANELTEYQNPLFLNTLARVQFARAEYRQAATTADKLLERISPLPPNAQAVLRARAALYQSAAKAHQAGDWEMATGKTE